jgi:hypothetical protein
MAIRPLPGELLEHLPRGIDQSQITHHVPLRGGPDGLLGETHLLLYRGNLEVLTRGSAKGAFRRLDLDPNERAMLLAEGWSVQLSLPTRDAPTRFDVSSKDVGTVLALISAVKPGERDEVLEFEMDLDIEAPAEAATEIVAAPAEPPPAPVVERLVQSGPRAAEPTAEVVSIPAPRPSTPAPRPEPSPAPVVAPAVTAEPETRAEESWRTPRSLRNAFAENERAEKQSATQETVEAERTLVGHAGHGASHSDLEALEALAERPAAPPSEPAQTHETTETRGPSALESAASSVRDLAATFRGAAASLRSAASSLRRGRQEPAPAPQLPADEASLAIDIDDAFDDAFDDTLAEAEAAFDAEEAKAEVTAPVEIPAAPPVVEAAPVKPRAKPERAALRFNFDELPAPTPAPQTPRSTPVAADYDGRGALFGDADPLADEEASEGADPNVSLAEFFDRHVPPTADDVPKRRRRMVPSATVPSPNRAPEVREAPEPAPVRSAPIDTPPARPQTPVAPLRSAPLSAPPTARPLTPAAVVPATIEVSPPTPVAPPLATPVAPPPPRPAVAVAAEPAQAELDENAAVALADRPRPNRRLVPPRWTDGARRSATAAGKAAGAAATATATAASAAVGRARVAANRLIDRRHTRSGRPRLNRRRQSGRGGRPTVAIAAALMTIMAVIYWALPSGDPQAIDTTAPVVEAQADAPTGMAAPIAELASEIRASQASVVPASAAHDLSPPLPGGDEIILDDDDVAEEEPEPAADRDFYGVATLTPESPQPELLALRECRPLIERGTEVRVKVEIDEPTGTVPEVWVGDSSMDREFRQCISRQFKKATFVPKGRGKLIKQRLKLHF